MTIEDAAQAAADRERQEKKIHDDEVYWAWAKTAPRCEGCGHPFDIESARAIKSPDPQRWCCSTCAMVKRSK